MIFSRYDIIIVGAGHAGCEAANAAAKMGSKVLLITMNMNLMAQMSCNPSVGGVAKGQIVREIDALGGMMGIVSDETMIQFRMLNRSKGPAMWSPRAQCDRMMFSERWRQKLENNKNVDFWQDQVVDIVVSNKKIWGVKTALGLKIQAEIVILTNGTFLNGIIHIGKKQLTGGRIGEHSSNGLTRSLQKHGIRSERLKTGTPVRVDGRSIDFSLLDEQKGDEYPEKFSFTNTPVLKKQRSCYLAYTNKKVHNILETGFDKSPLFMGIIKGTGPRYCPSIEDKIVRFSEKIRHQLFVEPEGWNTEEYYINGFSSSLPEEIQIKALREIKGFKNAKVFRPGYAIEYDFFPPEQLKYSLESGTIENLFFAGQVNGTTGYEEAAAQGLMAGINAHMKINNKGSFILKRSEAYIGVLIDDLINKGVDEPYRMFTSRAEYRILLRQDNADYRLAEKGFNNGMITAAFLKKTKTKYKKVDLLIDFLKSENISPEEVNDYLEQSGTATISQRVRLSNLVLRPQVSLEKLGKTCEKLRVYIKDNNINDKNILQQAEIMIKYETYIEKEKEIAGKISKLEDIIISENFNYKNLKSLSFEAREKLSKKKPATIGQALRISGVSPSDIAVILVHLGR